jgi:outer membrane autotransporter protein
MNKQAILQDAPVLTPDETSPVSVNARSGSKIRSCRPALLIAPVMACVAFLSLPTGAKAQVSLGEAQNFTVISAAGVTNSGPTIIIGNVALSPLTTITGFPPGSVIGTIHYNDTMASTALADAHTAYNNLAGLAYLPANNLTGFNLGGLSLNPGVYHFNTSAGLTGNLTLNTGGNANAVFVFQIGSTLTTAVGSSVVLTGAGAKTDPNVFWQVGSSATLNTLTTFDGNILALASISLGTGSVIVNGRLIALTGAVTLLSNTISAPATATIAVPGGTITVGPGGTIISVTGELSPQQFQIYGDLSISNATALVQEVDERLNNLRDGSENIDTTGVGGDTDKTNSGGGKDGDGKQVSPAPQQDDRRWGFFASGNGVFFRGDNHSADFNEGSANTAGTVMGVDARVGDHAVIGALFSYDNSAVTLGGNGSQATIESYTGGLYGAWHNDGFYLNGLADFTRNNYSSGRNILFPGMTSIASGGTHGYQYTADIDGGYDFHVTRHLTMGPIAGLQYDHLDVNGFDEYGAGADDLAVGEQTMNSLQSRIGARMDYHLFTTANTSFAAEFHTAWQHEFLNDSRAIGASFEDSGLSPFSVQTSSPLRDAAVAGVALNVTFHERFTLFTGYELQFWRAGYCEQSINAGGRIAF